MLKEFNINHYYVTNHKNYDKFTSEEGNNKLQQLQRGYAAHQMFTKMAEFSEAVAEASSYVVALEMARHSKALSDREFVKRMYAESS